MGVESFLVRLRGQQPDLQEIVVYSRRALGIVPDPEQQVLTSAYSYYVFRDGKHVIEFEFFQARESFDISIRFALCHPPSVDQIFIGHALALMRRFHLIATICEELPEGEPTDYGKEYLDRFTANCSWSIARARGYWREMFGSEEMGVSVSDALRWIIENQCRPVHQP